MKEYSGVITVIGGAALGLLYIGSYRHEVTALKELSAKELAALKELSAKELAALKELSTKELETKLAAQKELSAKELAALKELSEKELAALKELSTKELETKLAAQKELSTMELAAQKELLTERIENVMNKRLFDVYNGAEFKEATERRARFLEETKEPPQQPSTSATKSTITGDLQK
jgi:hypothetical protein